MTLFSIYAKPETAPDALAIVPDRFSFFALLFTPVWALVRGTFAFFGLWLVIAVGLFAAAPVIGNDVAFWLYVTFALWSGFAAPQIEGRALLGRNWIEHPSIAAPDSEAAEQIWLMRTYGVKA